MAAARRGAVPRAPRALAAAAWRGAVPRAPRALAAAALAAVALAAALVGARASGASPRSAPFVRSVGRAAYARLVRNPPGDASVVLFHDSGVGAGDDDEDTADVARELTRLHRALAAGATKEGEVTFVSIDCAEKANRFACDSEALVVPLVLVCRARAEGPASGERDSEARSCVPAHNARSAEALGETLLAALFKARQVALRQALGYMHDGDIEEVARQADPAEQDPRVRPGQVNPLGRETFLELVEDEYNRVPWVVYFYDKLHPGGMAPAARRNLALVATEFEARVRVASVNCGDEALRKRVCARYNVRLKGGLGLGAFHKGKPMDAANIEGDMRDEVAATASEVALRGYFQRVEAEAAPAHRVVELLDAAVLEYSCGRKLFCALLVAPHILDSGARRRHELLGEYRAMAAALRTESVGFLWAEAGAQLEIEGALGLADGAFAFPALALLSFGKGTYAVHSPREALTAASGEAFVRAIAAGRAPASIGAAAGRLTKGLPRVRVAEKWDGGEGAVDETDEFDLDDIMGGGGGGDGEADGKEEL